MFLVFKGSPDELENKKLYGSAQFIVSTVMNSDVEPYSFLFSNSSGDPLLAFLKFLFASMHPIILPKESTISRLIIESIHCAIGHLGKNSILTVLRQKFWIIGANGIMKRLVSKCVLCKKYQGKYGNQKMANLPKERLQADDPPIP
jgi:hypothetical protein